MGRTVPIIQHVDVMCDVCYAAIVGTHWHCVVCTDFDMCDVCYGAHRDKDHGTAHKADHVFCSLDMPRTVVMPYVNQHDKATCRCVDCVMARLIPAQDDMEVYLPWMQFPLKRTDFLGPGFSDADGLCFSKVEVKVALEITRIPK